MKFQELSFKEYQKAISDLPFLFTQSAEYGSLEEERGVKVRRFVLKEDDEAIVAFQFFKHHLIGKLSFGLIPYGPIFCQKPDRFIPDLKKFLKKLSKEEGLVFLRFDPQPTLVDEEEKIFGQFFTKANTATYTSPVFQPRREWWLDLNRSEKKMLKAMHKQTRYSIGRSERDGVLVEIIDDGLEKYFDEFYDLLKETAKRGGFCLHPKEHYEKIFSFKSDKPVFVLAIAKKGKEVLAMSVVEVLGSVGTFLYTGISQKGLDLRTSPFLRFEAIKYLKKENKKYASFGGVTKKTKNNSWTGFSNFKRRFGGFEVKHSPYFDLVKNLFWYKLYVFRKIIKSWFN